jgi:methylase of polypeptide subunit release factors
MNPVPTPLDRLSARRLRDFLADSGFTPHALAGHLGSARPAARRGALPFLLYRTSGQTVLQALMRWFVLGRPIESSTAGQIFKNQDLTLLLRANLLEEKEGRILPQVVLLPFEHGWIASDLVSYSASNDFVIPINTTTEALHYWTIPAPVESALDLGTGSGALGLQMARTCRQVVCTDLNPRAIDFARFNASLNDAGNVEFVLGDGFRPVSGRRFDRIVCNPPFFITPAGEKMYSENPEPLDGFCRKLIRQAPTVLSEGGTLQMLAEWVETRDQSWSERIEEWCADLGCDALVLYGPARDPEEYALERVQELNPAGSPADHTQTLVEWIQYYRGHQVQAVLSGLISLRRRSGRNWTRLIPMNQMPVEPVGDAIAAAISRQDYLQSVTDQALLSERLRLVSGAKLEQSLLRDGGAWKAQSVHMITTTGLRQRQAMTPAIADFLSGLDGTNTLGERILELSTDEPAPPEQIRRECLGLVRRMIGLGFLERERPGGAP